jgi:hypothetical protein
MTPTHPATGHPLLDQSEAEQALRVLAGLEPRPTCGMCSHGWWHRDVFVSRERFAGAAFFCHGVAFVMTVQVPPIEPACDLWEPRR